MNRLATLLPNTLFPDEKRSRDDWRRLTAVLATGIVFAILFWQPITTLVRDWWNDPEAGHGLLLGPIALYLAWRRGPAPRRAAQPILGLVILVGAVMLRYLSGLAAELFTMRLSLLGAAAALVIIVAGLRQLVHWWLPVLLLGLSVPIPTVVLNTLAFPLQLKASQMGAALLSWRDVPVLLTGNVIHIPGHSLFVTEACSGLRSLTALLALGLLIGGLWLRTPWARAALVAFAIPVAMLLNGVRVFLTGFLVYYVDPRLGEGFMHFTEGWALFGISFVILGGFAWLMTRLEQRLVPPPPSPAPHTNDDGGGRSSTTDGRPSRSGRPFARWAPAGIVAIAAFFTVGIDTQRTMALEASLDAVIPEQIGNFLGRDLDVPQDEIQAAGVSNYLMRAFTDGETSTGPAWSLYIGYYERQIQGKSIHSPKNCLPGAGWEALASSEATITTAEGPVPVNRYLLQKDKHQALVLYWYQGRGRVVANEYLVKANLLKDAALRQRSEEALVRIVVPITGTEREAYQTAASAAAVVIPNLSRALPG